MTSALPYAEVIGDPVEHSRSPIIHGFWLERLGLEAEYRRTCVSPSELVAFVAARRLDSLWRGCNVTMPLKLDALLLADKASDGAVQAGACNLIFPHNAGLRADNTDIDAIALVLDQLTGGKQIESVTLLGTGGAARAVLVALKRRGLHAVAVHGRNGQEREALAEQFALTLPPQPFDAPVGTAGLINATSLGMAGGPPLTLDLSAAPKLEWLFDLVSVPSPTELVQAAEQRGLAAAGGLAMLVEQAAASFPALFGADPPRSPADEAELARRLSQ